MASIDKTVAAAGDMKEAYIRMLLTRGVGELTYDVDRHAGLLLDHHRQAGRRAAGADHERRASRSRSCRFSAIIPDR